MARATFTQPAKGTRSETGEQVAIKKGAHYEVLEQSQTHVSYVVLVLKDPKDTYRGGGDGETTLPCTIRVQVPLEAVTIKPVVS